MDGISHMTGHGRNVLTIGGKQYQLRPKVLAEYAEREAYICSLKPNPLQVLEQLPALPAIPPPIMRGNDEPLDEYNQRRIEHTARVARIDAQHKARQALIDRAFREATQPQVVSFEDENKFDNSMHGIAWKLWRALRQDHPEIASVQHALDLIEQAGTEALGEINARLDEAEESALLKNSAGPDRATAAAVASNSPGADCMSTSPTTTAGPSSKSDS